MYFLEFKIILVSESNNQEANKNNFVMGFSCETVKSLCDGRLKPWKENVKLRNALT
jgi:hypothetical protein